MHAFALILLPHLQPDVEAQIGKLLEPYYMEKEVPEYRERVDATDEDFEWERSKGWIEQDEQGFFRRSTANPTGYWDYWRIGGRWNGYVNGQRIYNHGLTDAETVRVNTRSVQSLLQKRPSLETVLPAVVVTPDGVWHDSWLLNEFDADLKSQDRFDREKRREHLQKVWDQRVREILARYPNDLAVGLDVHS